MGMWRAGAGPEDDLGSTVDIPQVVLENVDAVQVRGDERLPDVHHVEILRKLCDPAILHEMSRAHCARLEFLGRTASD